MNYQASGLCYLLKPEAKADNTDLTIGIMLNPMQ